MKQGWNRNQQRTVSRIQHSLDQVIQVGRMVPVPVANLAATSALMTRGAQVSFLVTSLQGIDHLVLLRNFSRDPGSAKQIHVWPAASLASTPQTYPINLQHTDADPAIAGQKAYYWVKAVPVSNTTTQNTFLSGPQLFDASQQPAAAAITGDYPICQAYTPTTNPVTATTGGSANQATISIAAFQIQYPFDLDNDGDADLISYSGGSITPLLDNTLYFVYFNDPTYAGGAQTYIASVNNPDVTAGLYRQYLGTITTPVFGGGGTGGHGGGGGLGGPPCFSGNTKVVTQHGAVFICDVKVGDSVYSRAGWRKVASVLVHDFDGELHEMGSGELVTPQHRMHSREAKGWIPASEIYPVKVRFKGQVFNLSLSGGKSDNAHCYLLNNGRYAHNMLKF